MSEYALSFSQPLPRTPEALREADLAASVIHLDDYRDAPIDYVHGKADVEGAKTPLPYTLAVPKQLRTDSLAVFVSGFGAFKQTSREFRNALANEGIATVTYESPRLHNSQIAWLGHLADPQKLHYNAIGGITEALRSNEALAGLESGRTLMNNRLTLINHSMGNLAGLEFARQHPDLVQTVVSIGGAGLEKPLGLKLVPRAATVLRKDIVPAIVDGKFGFHPKLAAREAVYIGSNPLRTIAEIGSCMVADKRGVVAKLRELGVDVIALCPENDGFFYPADTLQGVGPHVAQYEVMEKSMHCTVQTEAVRTAKTVGRLLLKS